MLRGVLLIFTLCCASIVLAGAPVTQSTDAIVEQRIPFKKSEEATSGLLLRVLGGLIITALVGVGIVYGLKRYVPGMQGTSFGGSGLIKVVEVRRLTPKLTLFLIDVDGVRLLISQNGEQVSALYKDRDVSGNDGHRDA